MAVLKTNRISELRKAKGFSQAQLAEAVGVHWITISKLERGKTRFTFEWAERLAKALEVDEDEFLPAIRDVITVPVIAAVTGGGLVEDISSKGFSFTISTGTLFSSDSDWVTVVDHALFPYFHVGDLLQITWYFEASNGDPEPDWSGFLGRMCFVEDEDKDQFMGILAMGRDGSTLELHNTGHAPLSLVRPTALAMVTSAIMLPEDKFWKHGGDEASFRS